MLKSTNETTLTGLEISADMVNLAQRNVRQYGVEGRTRYVLSSGSRMPFEDGMFDAVFTNGSPHEWAEPKATPTNSVQDEVHSFVISVVESIGADLRGASAPWRVPRPDHPGDEGCPLEVTAVDGAFPSLVRL